jgi:F-type H+-transporting ATPase subunit b
MVFAANLLAPNPGLIFWTTLVFILLLVILSTFAWKPILKGIKTREQSIQDALDQAKKAREEMQQMQAQHEEIQKQARQEREQILRQAKETSDKIIAEAKQSAQQESKRILEDAHATIEREREAAFSEAKKEITQIAMEIAEKILRQELSSTQANEDLVNRYLAETELS